MIFEIETVFDLLVAIKWLINNFMVIGKIKIEFKELDDLKA